MSRYNPSLRFTGSDSEFESLIEHTKLAVYSTVLSYLAGNPDADDVVQETYIEAYFGYYSLADRGCLTAWLCGIARNLSLNRLKRSTHTAPLEAVSAKAVSDPESGYIKAESRRELLYAVAALPCKVAETVTLFYLAGKSIREISQITDTPEGTVKYRLHEGRKKLKGELEPVMKDEKNKIEDAHIEEKLRELIGLARLELRADRDRSASDYCDRAFELLSADNSPSDLLTQLFYIKGNSVFMRSREEALVWYRKAHDIKMNSGDYRKMVDAEVQLACDLSNLTDKTDETRDECTAHFKNAVTLAEASVNNDLLGYALLWYAHHTAKVDNKWGYNDYKRVLELTHREKLNEEDFDYLNAPLAQGIINALDELLPLDEGDNFFQTDVTIDVYIKKDGGYTLKSQPGFGIYGSQYFPEMCIIDVFYAAQLGVLLDRQFAEDGYIREITTQDYTDAKDIKERMYVVSRSETITVDAGTFYNCLHIKKDETRYGMTTDVWYAPGVGIVRVDFYKGNLGHGDSFYHRLVSYSVIPNENVGFDDTYLPFKVGNHWSYKPVSPDGSPLRADIDSVNRFEIWSDNDEQTVIMEWGYERLTESAEPQ